jgi:hypothetical protein
VTFIRRASAAAGAIILGLTSGWLTSVAGGSVDRAPTALTVMAVGLGGAGICLGALLGWVADKVGVSVAVLVLLVAFYLGTWLFSSYHSPVGDALFMIAASVPACLTAIAAFRIIRREENTATRSR